MTACTDHGLVLVAECPACGRPFRDQRHSHLRRVGAATVCGNPLGQGPLKQCQHDLTTLAAVPASPAVLATQARIDAALAGKNVPGARAAGQPAAYLADLRHLTTLLLHLAGQPGADGLAPWVADLALRRRRPHLDPRTTLGHAPTRRPRPARPGAWRPRTRSWPPPTSTPQPRC
ncbi:MAG: hypothetical protein V9G15_14200 [Dermatophilaceae bacterium]